MDPDERSGPTLPWWGWVLVLGGGVVLAWWLIGLVFRTLVWGVRTAMWVVVLGGALYLVLTLLGRRPGRGSNT